jgi:anhydro-N-acetylmuramic acid kinase
VNPTLYIGLISGTSRDGVDAALVSFTEDQPRLMETVCVPYPLDLARSLDRMVTTGQRPSAAALKQMDPLLADHFAGTVSLLLEKAAVKSQDIVAIGSHGQTVWHEPGGEHPESIQLGNPGRIARQTGIVTVGDFRHADIEAGGQGAPLAPLLHRALFRPSAEADTDTRVVLNLGGIANVSIIQRDGHVSGYDTGPANCLMDAWIRAHRGEAFDRDGDWAASGTCRPELLKKLLADAYFQKPAPKSTGIEYFNLAWLKKSAAVPEFAPRDIQATLAELTATTVTNAIRTHAPGDVLVCGGGAHNRHLLQRLRALLPGIPVISTAEFGLDPDWVEAVLFAWLARERLAEHALNTGSITGARNPVLLGNVAHPC